ncbi:hypothetical protein [Streptomyces sp. NPDC003996]
MTPLGGAERLIPNPLGPTDSHAITLTDELVTAFKEARRDPDLSAARQGRLAGAKAP